MDDGLLISRDEHDLNGNRNRYEKRRNDLVTMQFFLGRIVTVDALEREEGPCELIGDIEPLPLNVPCRISFHLSC